MNKLERILRPRIERERLRLSDANVGQICGECYWFKVTDEKSNEGICTIEFCPNEYDENTPCYDCNLFDSAAKEKESL